MLVYMSLSWVILDLFYAQEGGREREVGVELGRIPRIFLETRVLLGMCPTLATLITSANTLLNIQLQWGSNLQSVSPGKSQVSP